MAVILNRMFVQTKKLLDTDRGMAALLGLFTLMTFGIFATSTGFYWDDWIWKFFSSVYSSDYLLWQPVDRPLAGTLHILLNSIFGDDPFWWQMGNLFFRWTNTVGFYYLLRKIFPERKDIPAVLSVLFLVFPVFSEQWISIAFINHLLPLSMLWWSLILMFSALEATQKRTRLGLIGLSTLLAVLAMLTTEYFFGIEAFRVILLFYYLRKKLPQTKVIPVLWTTIKIWWGFGVLLLVMVLWRTGLGVAQGATYSVKLSRMFAQGILPGLGKFLTLAKNGIFSATGGVFKKIFTFPQLSELDVLRTMLFYLLIMVIFITSLLFYLRLLKKETVPFRRAAELIALGLAGLLLGGLPFWAGGLQYQPSFPEDRLGLPLMLGVSFLVGGLILLVGKFRWAVSVTLALLTAFSVGSNYLSGVAYSKSWAEQQVFWRQFVTRVPDLEPGTAVITDQLPQEFMSDLSFMMTLNWLYDSQPSEEALQYGLFFGSSRSMLKTVSESLPVVYNRRLVKFESSTEKFLVISYNQNYCLTIFDADEANLNPNSRHVNPEILPYANQDLIILDPDLPFTWPAFFDPIEDHSWCSYFEQAELALQRGDFPEVVRLGDEIFSLEGSPKKSWELAPFIEGYGFTSRWQQALDLTERVVTADAQGVDLICSVWDRIAAGTTESPERQAAFGQLGKSLHCDD